MYFWQFDIYFLILLVPAMLFSLLCSAWVKSAFRKSSRVQLRGGLTGAAAAQQVLYRSGVTDVRIEATGGHLSDHYDPKAKVIRLSPQVYGSATAAAVGVACHEAGHAAQHAESWMPIRVRNAILPVCNVGSSLALPLMLAGYFLNFFALITVGIVLFSLTTLFQLVTLPVEFNASRRALTVLEESGMVVGEEHKAAKRVLVAAAMTYVAALAVSVANLLVMVLRTRGRRR
jgi:Zn-dependent membrane protease YugP